MMEVDRFESNLQLNLPGTSAAFNNVMGGGRGLQSVCAQSVNPFHYSPIPQLHQQQTNLNQEALSELLLRIEANRGPNLSISDLGFFSGGEDEDFSCWADTFKALTRTLQGPQRLSLFRECLGKSDKEIFESFNHEEVDTMEKASEKMMNLYK